MNGQQYKVTKREAEKFRAAIDEYKARPVNDAFIEEICLAAMTHVHNELLELIAEYEEENGSY